MITPEDARTLALSFEGTDEKPHFERTAFTVKKKIFATLSLKDKTLNLRFTPQVQFIYCPPESDVIYPIDNAWGRQGWTTINLNNATQKRVYVHDTTYKLYDASNFNRFYNLQKDSLEQSPTALAKQTAQEQLIKNNFNQVLSNMQR